MEVQHQNLANIRKAWQEVVSALRPEDTLLLFLAGHGLVPPGTQMFYFAPSDFDQTSLATERDTGLSAAMLSDMLRTAPARRIVVVIDTCQSGAALSSLSKIGDVKFRVERADDTSIRGGIYLIASATALQDAVALPVEQPSPMIQVIMNLVTSEPKTQETNISAGELANTICERLPDYVKQTPLIYSAGDNLPLIVRLQ